MFSCDLLVGFNISRNLLIYDIVWKSGPTSCIATLVPRILFAMYVFGDFHEWKSNEIAFSSGQNMLVNDRPFCFILDKHLSLEKWI